jgi:hypothetical protein
MFLERMIQHVRPGKWAELETIDKEYNAIEARYGFPPKKRYQALFGGSNSDTLIIEREWESLTKMEATYMPYLNDPETQKLQAKSIQILDSIQTEMYWVLP